MNTVSVYAAPGLNKNMLMASLKTIRLKRWGIEAERLSKDEAIAARIMQTVCSYFKISIEQIKSQDRSGKVMIARHMIAEICRNKTSLGVVRIGKLINRHYSTVIASTEAVHDWIRFDKDFKETYNEILSYV